MQVKYRKGEENGAADYVSRLYEKLDGSYEVRYVWQTPQNFYKDEKGNVVCAHVTTRSMARARAQVQPTQMPTKLSYELFKQEQEKDQLVQYIANFKNRYELPQDKKLQISSKHISRTSYRRKAFGTYLKH